MGYYYEQAGHGFTIAESQAYNGAQQMWRLMGDTANDSLAIYQNGLEVIADITAAVGGLDRPAAHSLAILAGMEVNFGSPKYQSVFDLMVPTVAEAPECSDQQSSEPSRRQRLARFLGKLLRDNSGHGAMIGMIIPFAINPPK